MLAPVVVGALLAPAERGLHRALHPRGDVQRVRARVAAFLLRQPGFEDGDRPVAFASRGVLAPLAGDRFSHELRLVPARIRCDELARWTADAVLVVTPPVFFGASGGGALRGPRCLTGRRPAFEDVVFSVHLDGGRDAGRPRTMTTLHRRRPALAAALVYAVLAVLFVSPGLLPGKTLSNSDTLWFDPPWVSAKPAELTVPSNPISPTPRPSCTRSCGASPRRCRRCRCGTRPS